MAAKCTEKAICGAQKPGYLSDVVPAFLLALFMALQRAFVLFFPPESAPAAAPPPTPREPRGAHRRIDDRVSNPWPTAGKPPPLGQCLD